MGDALIVQVGLERTSSFKTEKEAARQDVEKIGEAVKTTAAALAVYQREARAADGGTAAMKANIQATRKELKGLQSDLRSATAEYKALSAASPTPPPPSKPDEPENGGLGRNQKQELMHSGKAILDMLSAGQSPMRALEVEGPRIAQSLGGSVEKILGTLTKIPVTSGMVAAGAATAGAAAIAIFASKIREAHEEAVKLNEETDKMGRPQSSLGGATAEGATQRVGETQAPIEKLQAGADSFWGNLFSNVSEAIVKPLSPAMQSVAGAINQVLPSSMNAGNLLIPEDSNSREQALQIAQQQQATRLGLAAEAGQRDNALAEESFSEGGANTASEKLEEEFKRRRDEIERLVASSPGLSDTALIKNLRDEIDLRKKIADLAAEQQRRQIETRGRKAEIDQPGVADLGKRGAPGEADPIMTFHTDMHSKAIDDAKRQLDLAQTNLDTIRQANQYEGDAVATLKEKAAAWMDVVRNARDELTAVQATTAEMELQAKGLPGRAKIASVTASYDAKIKKANDEGRTGDIPDLEEQKRLAVREAQADEALKTPQQRDQERRKARRRNQAADRAGHPGTRDADREGSMINDAGWDGKNSMIPMAGTGHGAVESPDNASDFDERFHGDISTRHMPDRGIPLPDQRVQIPTPAAASNNDFAAINKTLAQHGVYLATIAENVGYKGRGG